MVRALPNELARHLANLLQRTRRRYRRRLERCQEKCSEIAVHQLRVETRRALALLDLIATLEVAGSQRKARRTLKQRLDAFDELRDTQVELRFLKPWLRRYPEAVEFAEHLRAGEQELVAELRREIRALKPRRVERMLKTLEQDVQAARGVTTRPPVAFLQKPLRDAFTRVARLRRQVRRLDTDTIHRTRVAFKKFRYLCELFRPLMPHTTRLRLSAMRDWQTRMGEIQDVEVLLCNLESAVRHGRVSLDAVKRLHAKLARQLVVMVNRFIRTADRLDQFSPQAVDQPPRAAAP